MSELLAAALGYAGRGWPVFPCHTWDGAGCSCGRGDCDRPAKHPHTAHGFKDASTDAGQVRAWWRWWPDANIGLRTGVVVDVVDVDSTEALDALKQAAGPHPLGWGPIARTGKGWHYYLAVTDRRSRVGLLDGLDLRAADAYVIVPPSLHVSGRRYRWLLNAGPDDVTLTGPPGWLVRLLDPAPPEPKTGQRGDLVEGLSGFDGFRYALAALRSEAQLVANARGPQSAEKGTRNDTLNLAAFKMRRFVARGELATADVVEVLSDAALRAGLSEREARRTIASGLGNPW
jgi:hypothetical protein